MSTSIASRIYCVLPDSRSLIPDSLTLSPMNSRNRIVAALVVIASLVVPVSLRGQAKTQAIRFGKLWDGTNTISDAVVVVNGDRITAVGSGNRAVPAGAEVI